MTETKLPTQWVGDKSGPLVIGGLTIEVVSTRGREACLTWKIAEPKTEKRASPPGGLDRRND